MNEWISVDEQLPPEGVLVLATGKRGASMFVGKTGSSAVYTPGDGRLWMNVPGCPYWGDRYCTHWMPLPELPKEND